MRSASRAILLLAMGLAQPGAAQPPPAPAAQDDMRTLAVAADAPWRHAQTGMTLPARVGGLARRGIRDTTADERDVVATYVDRDDGVIALVYIYRTMTPDVALWFDRQIDTIMLPQANAARPAISPFTRPGASVASGLRAAMTDTVPPMTSTAVAIAPLGSWLVKVRMGAVRLDPAALDARLGAFVAALSWPAETGAARAAVPIEPCATPLRLRTARVIADRTENMLIDSVAGSLAAEHGAGPPPVYCREPGATIERGVYRPDGATGSYLIAMHEAGIAFAVGEATDVSALLGQGRGRRRFAMTLLERNSSSTYPSFDRLPPPDQALAVARATSPTSTTVGD